jgi:hypothetical protein
MCENTLAYNQIESVLGSNGRIFFPSQLLPMTIGLCSLIRILYLRFERWRSPEDIKPSLADTPETPTRAATVPKGKGWLRAFAPGTHVDGTKPTVTHMFEDSDLDESMVNQSVRWRYLVAWLPWLQATSVWFKNERSERFQNGISTDRKDDLESVSTANGERRGNSRSR